jgi:hypothetical protein
MFFFGEIIASKMELISIDDGDEFLCRMNQSRVKSTFYKIKSVNEIVYCAQST